MKISSTARRIAAVVVAIAAVTALTGVAQAGTSRPAGMTKSEYQALVLRSEALNQRYGLGKWAGVPPEFRALTIRSEALNKRYGLGGSSASAAARTPAGSSHGFALGAFGIGAAAMLGLVLVAGGMIVRSRFTRDAAGVRTS